MKTILFYVLFFQIKTIPFLLSEIPPNMEHPIYPAVFHQIKQTPCTCVYVTSFRPPFISSFPSLPPSLPRITIFPFFFPGIAYASFPFPLMYFISLREGIHTPRTLVALNFSSPVRTE